MKLPQRSNKSVPVAIFTPFEIGSLYTSDLLIVFLDWCFLNSCPTLPTYKKAFVVSAKVKAKGNCTENSGSRFEYKCSGTFRIFQISGRIAVSTGRNKHTCR